MEIIKSEEREKEFILEAKYKKQNFPTLHSKEKCFLFNLKTIKKRFS